jgi:hypothetical protein
MNPLQAIRLIILTLAIPTLLGCNSNKLTRIKAKNLLVEAFGLPKSESVEIKKKYDYMLNSWPKEMLYALQSKGLIALVDTMEVAVAEDSTGRAEPYKIVKLTDEGKKYLIEDDVLAGYYNLRSCDVAFGEVTGIQFQEHDKVAVVSYTIIRSNISPFGNNLLQGTDVQTATLSLESDGWKIDE